MKEEDVVRVGLSGLGAFSIVIGEVTTWFGILAPAGTPPEIINRLNGEWIKIAAMPNTKEKMQNSGLDPISSTPEQFSSFLKGEIAVWSKVIKDANIPSID